MTAETLMQRAKVLLPNLEKPTLELACELVAEQICNYCNLTELPEGLINTAVLMVRSLTDGLQLHTEQMDAFAKGVSRGDASFTFASPAEQLAQLAASGEFAVDYRAQLNAYRKMR